VDARGGESWGERATLQHVFISEGDGEVKVAPDFNAKKASFLVQAGNFDRSQDPVHCYRTQ